MADHLRNQIRDAIKSALTGLTTTGSRVYASRDHSMQAADLPGLRIFTGEEQISIQSLGVGRLRERKLLLVVEACVKANSAYDDTVDDICKEVEIKIDSAGTQTLGGLCKWIEPTGFQLDIDGDGDKTVAVGRMTFEVTYYTRQGAPDSSL